MPHLLPQCRSRPVYDFQPLDPKDLEALTGPLTYPAQDTQGPAVETYSMADDLNTVIPGYTSPDIVIPVTPSGSTEPVMAVDDYLIEARWTDTVPPIDIGHIVEGNINTRRNTAVGFHHRPGGNDEYKKD